MRETLLYLRKMREDGVIGNYAVGGAMAATFYIEPISTFDLDIFVVLPQTNNGLLVSLTPLYDHLREAGFKEDKECVLIEGVPVQFIPAYNPLTEEALINAATMDYDGTGVPVFSAEHLVAIALQTGRGKDRARVQAFIDAEVCNLTTLTDILKRHGLEEKWKLWTR